MKDEGTDEAKLTFDDLKVGDPFIAFPVPGDNSGHGGYLRGHRLFTKTENISSGKMVPIESGAAVDGRGVVAYFPHRMTVLKIVLCRDAREVGDI